MCCMILTVYVVLPISVSTAKLASCELIFLVAAQSLMKVCISNSTIGSIPAPKVMARSWTKAQPSLDKLVRSEMEALMIPSRRPRQPATNRSGKSVEALPAMSLRSFTMLSSRFIQFCSVSLPSNHWCMPLMISSSSRWVLTYVGSTDSVFASGSIGVVGLSLIRDEVLAARLGRTCIADAGRDSGSVLAPGGFNSFTIADSIAGRTLKFFSCFFRSDFAAFGASLQHR